MKTGRSKNLFHLGLLCFMLCFVSLTGLTGIAEAAAPVAQVPIGPRDVNGNWATPDYYTTANWANSPPLAKFVDTLPGLTAANVNNLGQYLPVAVPDKTTYPGSDYYIIELREYKEKMHSDLNPTTLRGYVQVDANGNDVAPIHYLGPIIVSERDRPVRIKFINKLPTGAGGDLFIPVDTTVMGAGKGPMTVGGQPCDNTIENNTCASYTQNRADLHLHGGRTPWISDGTPHQWIIPDGETTPFTHGVSKQNVPDMPDPGPGATTYYYTNQQSARLMFYHDHAFGITRLNVYAGEAAGYLITDKFEQDLINRGILPADQIPLVIQDKTFVDATTTTKYIYNPATGLFDTPITVPSVRATDPLWNWGTGTLDANGVRQPVTGDLWLPHVYMPAQLPTGSATGGVNPFGRWMYGPWFYPATAVTHGPVANPYYDPNCSSPDPFVLAQCETPGQPPLIPGTPHPSMGMEAFQDSVVVNGTVFPSLTVDPRAYRFRILNAASDRFWNLSFYVADPAQVSPDARLTGPGKSNLTEVKMVPASLDLATLNNWPPLWPVDGRDGGVPDPAFRGPNFLQIGSEGGFLPSPVLIEPQPITYMTDPTAFWVGVVDKMGLALGPAERADVVVDFSAYAGKTLILYNDAPAAWPARVPGYDYFTGAPDMRDSGGYGTGGTWDPITGTWVGGTGPLVGYAPNTRTVMQIIVRPTLSGPGNTYSQANLEKEFTSTAPTTAVNPAPAKTLFERSQEPIIVGQAAYSSAYPNSYFPTNFPWEGVNQINDHFLQFVTVNGEQVKAPTEPKGIHDEMGASFDPEYGRMSGNLAMQLPNPTTLNALLILYGYSDIPTEFVNNSVSLNVEVLPGANGQPGTLKDGTQIWKISHNGVDTHPIHFHIFDVQLVNRVGWDGQILMPEPNELGWKDTVKISPLMDTIVAVRPRAPALPFGIPNSIRPLNPAIPIDSAMGFSPVPTNGSAWPFFNSVDWTTGEIYPANDPVYPYPNYKGVVTNVLYDMGWEYVWHCHILSHEEMDMMRTIKLKVDSVVPPAFTATATPNGGRVDVTWNDPTPINYVALDQIETYRNAANEIGFNVYRSTDGGTTFDKLNTANLLANSTSYSDNSPVAGSVYKVEAFNAAGSTYSPVTSSIAVTVSVRNLPLSTAPATVSLGASINGLPAGITITSVDFYNGTTLLGSDTTSPYRFSWTNVMGGVYSVTAKVTDNRGIVTTSAPIDVTVTGNLTADFTITGSTPGPEFGFCDNNITLTSTSTGNITDYSWSLGGTGSVTTFPAGMIPGTYPVTLTVSDIGTGETAQITKNVVIINHAPTAVAGGPYFVNPGGSLTLSGSGSDPLDSCSTSPLSYAWNVDNRGAFDYFTANPTISYNTLSAVLGNGTHTMTFQVTDSNGGIGTATTTVTVAAVSLIPTPASPQLPGTAVSFTASAAGVGPYEYQFQLNNVVVQNYSASAIWNWNTTGVTPGTYQIQVDARQVGTTTVVSNAISYVIAGPASAVTLTPAPASPTVPGTPITFTAAASGGIGNYEYKFSIAAPGGALLQVQNYSTTAAYNWTTTGLAVGTYQVVVHTRNVGSTAAYESFKSINYVLSFPPVTAVTLTPAPASPAAPGTPVTFTAAASGVTGNYEYRFSLATPGGGLLPVQNYSTVATWNWTTTGLAAGTYQVVVYARNVGSTAAYESFKSINFVLAYPPVNAVTLTPAPASPAAPGTPVTFTAAASGGTGSYEYKFLLAAPGGALLQVQNYSTVATWNWTTTGLSAGTYQVVVHARNVGSTAAYESFKSINYVLSPPAGAVTLTPAPASPVVPGTPVNFTAAATGGSGNYEYRFFLAAPGGALLQVQNYSTVATWNWTTTGLATGIYQVVVHARNVGSTALYESFKSINYTLTPPASAVTLTPAPTSPAAPGTPITFTAAAAGGSGNYEYRFFLAAPGGALLQVQNYSTVATWNWTTTGLAAGTYQVVVWARNVGSTANYESFKSINYVLTFPPASAVTLTPAPASPTVVGTPVTFTAAATGGTGNYEYRFFLAAPGGALLQVQNYSTVATWNWATTGLTAGTYQVVVWARNVGSTANYDSFKSINYVLAFPPVSAVNLTPAPTSPVVPGTPVTFTAAASGVSGNYEYKFSLATPGGALLPVQNYSAVATWNWTTTGLAAGTYQVVVYARNVGSTANYESFKSINYVLAYPPVSAVTLTPAPASPAVVGTPVTFTAAASGVSGNYEYKFSLAAPGGALLQVQNYSTVATWNWTTTGLAAGTYQVVVHARNVGSAATYEAFKSINFVLAP